MSCIVRAMFRMMWLSALLDCEVGIGVEGVSEVGARTG